MKVLMIENFLPNNTYTKELCKYLTKHCEVTIITDRKYVDDGKLNWKCIPCLYRGGETKVKAIFYSIIGYITIIFNLLFFKYDVVHVQTFKLKRIELSIYKLLCSKKLVHTVHNVVPHEIFKGDIETDKSFYFNFKRLIVHNEYCKKLLIEDYNISKEKISVIPHGAYEIKTRQRTFTENNGKINFLTLGAIRKYKGIDVLLKAIALIPKDIVENMHFTIAGNQNKKIDNTDYERLIKDLNIDKYLTFMPHRVDDDELDRLYSNADACIFPYKEIYGSGALLMAYSYSKPVIVSDVPAFVEETANGMTGLLFKSEDASSLKEAIEKFANMPTKEADSFIKNVEKLVVEKYNWKRSAEELFSYYQEFLRQEG